MESGTSEFKAAVIILSSDAGRSRLLTEQYHNQEECTVGQVPVVCPVVRTCHLLLGVRGSILVGELESLYIKWPKNHKTPCPSENTFSGARDPTVTAGAYRS